MFQNQILTIYNFFVKEDKSIEVYRHISRCGFVDEKRRSSYLQDGKKAAHTAYISINELSEYMSEHLWLQLVDKSTHFTVQNNSLDFCVIGGSELEIDTSTLATIQAGFDSLKQDYKVYKFREYDEKFHGSRRMWHVEVGGL